MSEPIYQIRANDLHQRGECTRIAVAGETITIAFDRVTGIGTRDGDDRFPEAVAAAFRRQDPEEHYFTLLLVAADVESETPDAGDEAPERDDAPSDPPIRPRRRKADPSAV